jgi:tRNA(Arg) A34 adenosine deaminase TadA
MPQKRVVHPVSVVAGSIDTASWRGLPDPWRRCFILAWQSRLAGSVPVGAVLVDRHGEVVAEGRNRFGEQAAPAGQLAGTALGHAELNALAQLAPGSYEQHVLYTSLEPCLLCTAALTHTHVGQVRFAAADPLWRGLQRLPELNEHVARRWAVRTGPLSGPLAVWGQLLPLLWVLDHSPTGVVVTAHQRHARPVLDLARRLQQDAPPALASASLDEALDALWPRLVAAAKRPFAPE